MVTKEEETVAEVKSEEEYVFSTEVPEDSKEKEQKEPGTAFETKKKPKPRQYTRRANQT